VCLESSICLVYALDANHKCVYVSNVCVLSGEIHDDVCV